MIKAMTNLALFERILNDLLQLKHPPVVRISKTIRFQKADCYGLYEGEETRKGRFTHKIRVSKALANDPAALFAVLAHEFIHAWQMEFGLDTHHDKAFINWAKYFAKRYLVDIVKMVEVTEN